MRSIRNTLALLWYLTGIPGPLAARRAAALAAQAETARVEVLRLRVVETLRDAGELSSAPLLVLGKRPRTVAELAAQAAPGRDALPPELRRALWPEDPS